MAPKDWRMGCTQLKQRVSYLFYNQEWSDCKFLVGSEPEPVPIRAHKLLLCISSPVFEAMFFGEAAEKSEVITVPDVQPVAFDALMKYIYKDDIVINSFDEACELYYVAKKYKISHLMLACIKAINYGIKSCNACDVYKFAKLYDEKELMNCSLNFIRSNTKVVLSGKSFEDADINTVITIFSQEELNIDSELDLFDALVKYAEALDKQMKEESWSFQDASTGCPTLNNQVGSTAESGTSPSDEDAANGTAVIADPTDQSKLNGANGTGDSTPAPATRVTSATKRQLQAAIEKIRFLTLTPQQFAECVAKTSLLTESEGYAILLNITSNNTSVPMPRNFSTCRELRSRKLVQDFMGKLGSKTFNWQPALPGPEINLKEDTKGQQKSRQLALAIPELNIMQETQQQKIKQPVPPVTELNSKQEIEQHTIRQSDTPVSKLNLKQETQQQKIRQPVLPVPELNLKKTETVPHKIRQPTTPVSGLNLNQEIEQHKIEQPVSPLSELNLIKQETDQQKIRLPAIPELNMKQETVRQYKYKTYRRKRIVSVVVHNG